MQAGYISHGDSPTDTGTSHWRLAASHSAERLWFSGNRLAVCTFPRSGGQKVGEPVRFPLFLAGLDKRQAIPRILEFSCNDSCFYGTL